MLKCMQLRVERERERERFKHYRGELEKERGGGEGWEGPVGDKLIMEVAFILSGFVPTPIQITSSIPISHCFKLQMAAQFCKQSMIWTIDCIVMSEFIEYSSYGKFTSKALWGKKEKKKEKKKKKKDS